MIKGLKFTIHYSGLMVYGFTVHGAGFRVYDVGGLRGQGLGSMFLEYLFNV
jgi:hypothetical protein